MNWLNSWRKSRIFKTIFLKFVHSLNRSLWLPISEIRTITLFCDNKDNKTSIFICLCVLDISTLYFALQIVLLPMYFWKNLRYWLLSIKPFMAPAGLFRNGSLMVWTSMNSDRILGVTKIKSY